MRTFFARLWVLGRFFVGLPGRASRFTAFGLGGVLSTRVRLISEAGDTLIEVLISSLLVGLIVVAMFNGFSETNRVSQDERSHNQATVLAAQSQEQLRSDPAPTLDTLASTPHEYTQTVGGTVYTITQSAQFVNGSGAAAGCSNSKNESEATKYLEISSSVTWSRLKAAKRAAVTQSSVITPPDGSGLEVDVTNLNTPEEGIPEVSVTSGGVETKTNTKGCVIYSGIPATTASVEAYRLGYVTPNGEHKVVAKEISIAPNITTHYPINLGHGGSIKAEFTNKGARVNGDTFVAFNNKMGVAPEFEVGSTRFKYNAEDEYEPLTGSVTGTTTEGYTTPAETAAVSPYYPTGDLFPFTSAWSVYAGDCKENNPAKDGLTAGSAVVKPGEPATAEKVPTSKVTLNVYKKTATAAEKETVKREVKITNKSCVKSTEQVAENATKANFEHRQMTTEKGELEFPYQPFGEFEICLAYNKGAIHRTYTITSYENKTEEGLTLPSILTEGTTTSWTKVEPGSEAKC
jgi:Tfp pilus assembly protein PilV